MQFFISDLKYLHFLIEIQLQVWFAKSYHKYYLMGNKEISTKQKCRFPSKVIQQRMFDLGETNSASIAQVTLRNYRIRIFHF